MIYVMGDVHGNDRRFHSILEQIDLRPNDTLYLLGDVIDRFPGGIRILRSIMQMPNVRMLLGNHEYMMLKALDGNWGESALQLWYRNGGNVTHDYWKHIKKSARAEIVAYLMTLPLNIDITVNDIHYKLVHAAAEDLYSAYKWKYGSKREFAVWMRWRVFDHPPAGYTMIFGHTPTVYYQPDNPLAIWYDTNRIGMDCGSGFPDTPQEDFPIQGRLACLRLDDMKEFYSEEVMNKDERETNRPEG